MASSFQSTWRSCCSHSERRRGRDRGARRWNRRVSCYAHYGGQRKGHPEVGIVEVAASSSSHHSSFSAATMTPPMTVLARETASTTLTAASAISREILDPASATATRMSFLVAGSQLPARFRSIATVSSPCAAPSGPEVAEQAISEASPCRRQGRATAIPQGSTPSIRDRSDAAPIVKPARPYRRCHDPFAGVSGGGCALATTDSSPP